jgi:Topoisomerase IA
MSVAQKLYEGLPLGERGPMGLITYMRTDSVRISAEAQAWARAAIVQSFSAAHVPSHPRVHANKGKAQDAHEAIRPTSPELTPEAVRPYLKKEEFSLYQLIWNRFFASQMSAAVLEETALTIAAGERFLFTVKGGVIKFKGWWELYPKKEEDEEDALPPVKKDETLTLAELEPKQSFTQPPARYTEGTLVKELEAKGIGRPSTYAPIIATLQNRVYVVKEENKFVPTDLGMFVTDFLVKHFPDLMEYKFTARMEGELDEVSEGTLDWVGAMRDFYGRLQNDLAAAGKVESVAGTGIPLDEKCPKCGKLLVNKGGKFGRFKSCSGYPECDYSDDLYKKKRARSPRGKMPDVRGEPGPAGRPLRDVRGLLELSEMPVHQGEGKGRYGDRLSPRVRRDAFEKKDETGEILLRLQLLPEVPVRHLGRAASGILSEMRPAVRPPENDQEGRDVQALCRRELRLARAGVSSGRPASSGGGRTRAGRERRRLEGRRGGCSGQTGAGSRRGLRSIPKIAAVAQLLRLEGERLRSLGRINRKYRSAFFWICGRISLK